MVRNSMSLLMAQLKFLHSNLVTTFPEGIVSVT